MKRLASIAVFMSYFFASTLGNHASAQDFEAVESRLETLAPNISTLSRERVARSIVLDASFTAPVEETGTPVPVDRRYPVATQRAAEQIAIRAGRTDLTGGRAVEEILSQLKAATTAPPAFDMREVIRLGQAESVILVDALQRPSLRVAEDRISDCVPDEPPASWNTAFEPLEVRQRIEKSLASVGGIYCTNDPYLNSSGILGTSFVIGDRFALTNRHVAALFALPNRQGSEGTLRRMYNELGELVEYSIFIDFHRFHATAQSPRRAKVRGVAYWPKGEFEDFAILEIEAIAGTIPESLETFDSAPENLIGRKVWVAGFPAMNSWGIIPQYEIDAIFGVPLGVKRLSPGEIIDVNVESELAEANFIHHDCATLGGSSGSPVIDLETGRILSLHFQGLYGQRNDSIPIWNILNVPEVQTLLVSE